MTQFNQGSSKSSRLEAAHQFFGIFGAIASALIAVVAIFIETQLDNRATQNQKVNRSISLHDDFSQSSAMERIIKISNRIEYAVNNDNVDLKDVSVGEKYITYTVKTIDILKNGDKDADIPILDEVKILLQKVETIASCARFDNIDDPFGKKSRTVGIFSSVKDLFVDEKKRELCDKNTILTLFGPRLIDLYYSLRPFIFCTDHFAPSDLLNLKILVKAAMIQKRNESGPFYVVEARSDVDPKWKPEEYRVLNFEANDHDCTSVKRELRQSL